MLLLNDMESQGLIRWVRDPDDRRRHLIEAADHGHATLHRLLAEALGD